MGTRVALDASGLNPVGYSSPPLRRKSDLRIPGGRGEGVLVQTTLTRVCGRLDAEAERVTSGGLAKSMAGTEVNESLSGREVATILPQPACFIKQGHLVKNERNSSYCERCEHRFFR